MATTMIDVQSLDLVSKINFNKLLRKNNVERSLKYAKILVVLLVLLSLAWSIYIYLSQTLVTQTEINKILGGVDQRINTLESTTGQKTNDLDYSVIGTSKIFGEIVIKTAANSEASKPKSDVALSLVGTFLDTGEPLAIIQDDKKKEQDVFAVNQSIFDTAQLVKIYPEHVEIDRNGKIEVLYIDEGGSAPAAGGNETPGETIAVDAQEVDQALENLPLLLTQARAVPYFKDGKSVGLRLFAIKTGSLFQKIGLKNGDILKSINDNSLADITQAVKLFEKLKEERSVSLTLERGRKEYSYNYEIN